MKVTAQPCWPAQQGGGHCQQVQHSNGTVVGFDPLQAPRPSLHSTT